MKSFKLKYEIEKSISLDTIKALLPTDLSWEKNVRSYNFLPCFQLELLVENFRGEANLQRISINLQDLQEDVTYDLETQIQPSFTLEKTAHTFKIYWCLSSADLPISNILDWFDFFDWEIPSELAVSLQKNHNINRLLTDHQLMFFYKLLDWQTDFTIPLEKLPNPHLIPYELYESRVREAIDLPSRKIDRLYEID